MPDLAAATADTRQPDSLVACILDRVSSSTAKDMFSSHACRLQLAGVMQQCSHQKRAYMPASWRHNENELQKRPLLTTYHMVQIVERLEAVLQLQRFTQLGGLQLERDVRMLTGALGEVTQRTVRDKFARLAQMALLLSVEVRSSRPDEGPLSIASAHCLQLCTHRTPCRLHNVIAGTRRSCTIHSWFMFIQASPLLVGLQAASMQATAAAMHVLAAADKPVGCRRWRKCSSSGAAQPGALGRLRCAALALLRLLRKHNHAAWLAHCAGALCAYMVS